MLCIRARINTHKHTRTHAHNEWSHIVVDVLYRGLLKCVWRFILISMVLWLKSSDIRTVGIEFPIATSMNGPRRKEGNVLFNDTLNTFYLRLYSIGHMVKDHSDSERGNPLPPPLYRHCFPISSKVSFMSTPLHTG